jgi:YVTN family beta-propeller protein
MRTVKYICAIGTFILVSCVKDKPNDVMQPEVHLSGGSKVFITNEGNFGTNNASVSLYDPVNGQVITDIYGAQNSNAVLGDVCQSMTRINGNYYVVVNNSSKIVVADENFKLKSTISGLPSPRFILPVTFGKAYVSNYSGNSISIIDLNTNSKTGSIPCQGWTEQMAMIYNKVFVTNNNSDYTYVINAINDQVTDSVNVGKFGGSIVIDKNSKVWILSGGDNSSSQAGRLSRIDPITLQVELSLPFTLSDSPGNLCINLTKDTLYYLNKHVYRMAIAQNSLPGSAFVTSSSNTFYGLAVSHKDHCIYVSDAIDYIQKSSILIYSPNALLKTTFKAGINASGFYFE